MLHNFDLTPFYGELLKDNKYLTALILQTPHSQISTTKPHYKKYSKNLFLIAIIDYKWNVYVITTIENI